MKLLVISRNSINEVQMIGSGEAGGCWEVLGFHITLQLEEDTIQVHVDDGDDHDNDNDKQSSDDDENDENDDDDAGGGQ